MAGDFGSSEATLSIDLGAIAANWRRLRAMSTAINVGAVVKADCYGLGARQIVPVLAAAGCRHFFVALPSEALAIRDLIAPGGWVAILNGLAPGSEVAMAQTGFVPVLNSLQQARRWQAHANAEHRPLPALLQVDSGMSRLGLCEEDAVTLAKDAAFGAAVPLLAVMSHLACADEPDNAANADQLRRFNRVADRFPGVPRSLANSAGCLLRPEWHGDLARPGLALYGAEPALCGDAGFAPVVRLDAPVLQTRTIPAGAAVGYGLTWRAHEPTRLATVGVGYADGWLRSLSSSGAAWFDGIRLPIAGRVSMDSIVLDIRDLPTGRLEEGDRVELIGPHQPLEAVARDAGTIAYEILTSLGRRYRRHYLTAAVGDTQSSTEISA